MTDKERIENLEKEVAFLKQRMNDKRLSNNWSTLSKRIDEQLFIAFGTNGFTPQIAQCKSSISCLVGKSFCKSSVLSLSAKESEEAEVLVDYILDFMKSTRKRYALENPVRGYERESIKEDKP